MTEWADLRPIFDVFTRETGYEGGGKLRLSWWRQAAAEKNLKVTVEEILAAARVRRQQEFVKHGDNEGSLKGESKDRKW